MNRDDLKKMQIDVIERNYQEAVGHMNRAERRTEKGRRLVAEAKLRAAEDKLKMIEDQNENS